MFSRPFVAWMTLSVLFSSATQAFARKKVRTFHLHEELACAPVAVVGTVIEVDPEVRFISQPANPTAQEAVRMVTIKVKESLFGLNGVTHVRLAVRPNRDLIARNFQAMDEWGEVKGNLGGGMNPNRLIEPGKTGVYLLRQYPGQDFYVFDGYAHKYVSDEEHNKFRYEDAIRWGRIIGDPLKALKAEKVEDRTEAACILVRHYRKIGYGYLEFTAERGQKQIDAEISKLLLKELAVIEWTNYQAPKNLLSIWEVTYNLGANGKLDYDKVLQDNPSQDDLLRKFKEWLQDSKRGGQFRMFETVESVRLQSPTAPSE